jgi:AraC-type DNA-binding domain-containing proteins
MDDIQQLAKSSKNPSLDDLLQNLGIQKSFLTFHNLGSSISEFVEIGMPYMILYESFNIPNDRVVTYEFTEAKRNDTYSKYSEENKNSKRPLHSHDFYELTIVLSGTVKLQIENEIITYKEGECCLCNKHIHHKEIVNSDCEMILFLLKEEYIRSVLEEDILYHENGKPYIHDTIFQHLFSPKQKNPFYTAKEYIDFRVKETFDINKLLALLNAIILEIHEKKSGRSYLMKGYFCRLIDLLSDPAYHSVASHQAKLSKEEEILYQISSFLEKNNSKISRQELEKELNYNSDYMNRIIKKHTGKSLMEYSKMFLLNEATNLLKNTDLQIGEICEALGYTNRNFFHKIFYNRYGMTPSEYRHKRKS